MGLEYVVNEGHVMECDGCGDTAYFIDAMLEWARVIVGGQTFVLCSCDCFYAWNYHVPWPGPFGDRPGDKCRAGMPF